MMITEDEFEKYKLAGKITAKVLEYGKELIVKNSSLLDVTEIIEKKILELGGIPAFPVQISLNGTAAHFCPDKDDKTILDKQLCSLDVGVHIDGYIGDSAITVDLSRKNQDLVKAAEEALKAALEITRIGQTLGKIGESIEHTIKSYGFNPVRNLSGHGLSRYNIHDKPTVPNYDSGDNFKLEKGMTIAIEPFATTGIGLIHEKGKETLFDVKEKKSVRVGFVRDILKHIQSYNGLPFTTRWLTNKYSEAQVNYSLNQLRQLGVLHAYPPLVEKSSGLVSQAEHSVYIDDEIVVLTKL